MCCQFLTPEEKDKIYELDMLTRSLREPAGPCTQSMEVSESRMERVNFMKHAFGFDTGLG